MLFMTGQAKVKMSVKKPTINFSLPGLSQYYFDYTKIA